MSIDSLFTRFELEFAQYQQSAVCTANRQIKTEAKSMTSSFTKQN